MSPSSTLASTGICLAEPGRAYVVYAHRGEKISVDLSAAAGQMNVNWIDPRTGAVAQGRSVSGGRVRSFNPPLDGDAVLYLKTWTSEEQRRHE